MTDKKDDCPLGIQNRQRIIELEKDHANLVSEVDKKNSDLWTAIVSIRDRLMLRPTWTVATIIAILSSLTLASLSYAFTIMGQMSRIEQLINQLTKLR